MSKNWKIIREADDPIALRISVGASPSDLGYIVYRGSTQDCLALLEEATDRLKKHLEEQGE